MEQLSKRNVYIGLYLCMLATFFVVLYSESTSPLFITRSLDSEIFQYMGYIITQGKIPYTDFFDHKGLFLYFFNALGLLISKKWGVMLLQIIFMAVVLCLWYKGLSMIRNLLFRITIIPILLLCLCQYYEWGNLTEDWSLLFISYPLVRYIQNVEQQRSHFSSSELVKIGLCMGIITMIRINNLAPLLGLLLFCSFDTIKRKEFSYLFQAIYFVLLGWLIPVFISITYMYFTGQMRGVHDMIFANLIFNLDYNATYTTSPFNLEYIKSIYKVFLPLPFVLIVSYKKKNYLFPILVGYIITFLTIGGKHYAHYYMVFLPLIVFSVVAVKEKFRYLLVILLFFFYIKPFYASFSVERFLKHHENSALKLSEMLTNIPITERNNVWSYNGALLLTDYINNGLIQCNRMFLSGQIDISEELRQTEYNKITKVNPKYILYAEYVEDWMCRVDKYRGKTTDDIFIKKNYEVVSSVTFEDGTKVYCYKLKQ